MHLIYLGSGLSFCRVQIFFFLFIQISKAKGTSGVEDTAGVRDLGYKIIGYLIFFSMGFSTATYPII